MSFPGSRLEGMEAISRETMPWQLRTRTLELGRRTLVMGIVNITPDSFSDGGAFLDPEAAVAHALQLLDEGADLLDLGAESTRPGSRAGVVQVALLLRMGSGCQRGRRAGAAAAGAGRNSQGATKCGGLGGYL
jgi:hypothetical protein